MLRKLKVRGCTVPRPLTWPSAKKYDGTEELAMTSSVDGCSVLLETKFAWSQLCMMTTQVLPVGSSLPLWELPERVLSLTSNRLLRLHS